MLALECVYVVFRCTRSYCLDGAAPPLVRIVLFLIKYAYHVIFFFVMVLVVFWTMNDLQCTKILPAHSEERSQFRIVYGKTLRSAVISCDFCLNQTLEINLRNFFCFLTFFFTLDVFRC